MFLAHGPASYIANELIQQKEIKKLKFHEQLIIGACSVIFGILPDADLLALMATSFPTFKHHDIFTHTPFFYLVLFGLLLLVTKYITKFFNSKTKKILNKDFMNILLKTFLISTLIHLLMDLLVSNILLFYPISTRPFTIFKYLLEPSLISGLFFSTMFAIEISIIVLFKYMLLKKSFKNLKWIHLTSKIFLLLSIIYIAFTFGISRFTYNHSYMYDTNGNINYDTDYDTLRDDMDLDINNNGLNNLEDAQASLITNRARDISESGKLTLGRSKGLVRDIKHLYGAMNSYDLILQTYYDAHLPISPILKDHYSTNNGYIHEYSSDKLLYQYLDEKEYLISLNLKADVLLASGKMFFIQDLDGKILNLGITLENNELAIVLETDTKLQLHTYTEVLSKYGKDIQIQIQK